MSERADWSENVETFAHAVADAAVKFLQRLVLFTPSASTSLGKLELSSDRDAERSSIPPDFPISQREDRPSIEFESALMESLDRAFARSAHSSDPMWKNSRKFLVSCHGESFSGPGYMYAIVFSQNEIESVVYSLARQKFDSYFSLIRELSNEVKRQVPLAFAVFVDTHPIGQSPNTLLSFATCGLGGAHEGILNEIVQKTKRAVGDPISVVKTITDGRDHISLVKNPRVVNAFESMFPEDSCQQESAFDVSSGTSEMGWINEFFAKCRLLMLQQSRGDYPDWLNLGVLISLVGLFASTICVYVFGGASKYFLLLFFLSFSFFGIWADSLRLKSKR